MEVRSKMRFLEHINEEAGGRAFAKRICEECIPFLQESGGRAYYRGGQAWDEKKGYSVYKPIPNRKPTDTIMPLHDAANKYFNEHFGWNARSGIFITPQHSVAWNYRRGLSNAAVFIPIGEIKYVWSPEVKDFTNMFDNVDQSGYDEKGEKAALNSDMKKLNKILPTYIDENLKVNKENEVSVLCTSYYIFEPKLAFDILRYFSTMRRY